MHTLDLNGTWAFHDAATPTECLPAPVPGSGHLAHEHIDLVAEGLDTFCTIRLNGEEIARTDNALRP
jgi:hypothetical protein